MPDGPTGPAKVLQTLRRLPRQFLIGLVRVYQVVLSPHQPATCRFSPTCSAYAVEALRKYGAVKGTILAVHRVLRCNPWGGHGYDPPRWYGEPAPDETAGPSRHDHHRGVSHGL